MTDLQDILRKNNLKATHQRLVILNEIKYAGHIELDALYKKIKKNFPTMALATLYRNLSDMISKDILTEVKVPKNKNIYELTKKEHAHLICNICGCIKDYPIDEKIKEFFLDLGNSPTNIQLNIGHTCKQCQKL